jgi:hypothetical protein
MTKTLKRRCESGWDNSRCGFRRSGKAMGHVYPCRWRICREITVSSRFEYHIFYVLYPFVIHLLTLPRTYAHACVYAFLPYCHISIYVPSYTFIPLFLHRTLLLIPISASIVLKPLAQNLSSGSTFPLRYIRGKSPVL